ncbi:ORF6N domain-containing protein [Agriterribacter sp.]|uniref:ORF6N domain-containing protein n=1 Tax=Agriterribacter sp. TaxID=2821509 RepID=UPI002B99D19E|nr:ORF6N domain-containing protein [Agriterribacter sp.]HRO45764.1 ORF6N domain-containing protein [Agriterribacter sp.]HRQ16781.1 ORF6N domain-containing protein [Agriterribacter sp.]
MDITIIQQKIYEIRGEKVMLDFDLANLYGIETKVLNQSVRRNPGRFPPDFMFQLTPTEWNGLRSQIVTSNRGGRRYLPNAFTEHGVTMLASVLKSDTAVKINVAIVRAFIALRQMAHQYKELAEKLAEIEQSSNKKFKDIYQALHFLLNKKEQEEDFSKRERIGFRK